MGHGMKIIPAFNAKYPNIEVVFQTTIPNQYAASVSAKLEEKCW